MISQEHFVIVDFNQTCMDIADFIGLPYSFRFPLGLKSHVLISHDYLSQTKFVP